MLTVGIIGVGERYEYWYCAVSDLVSESEILPAHVRLINYPPHNRILPATVLGSCLSRTTTTAEASSGSRFQHVFNQVLGYHVILPKAGEETFSHICPPPSCNPATQLPPPFLSFKIEFENLKYRTGNERPTKWLTPTVNVLKVCA